jgi:hypothetical protein
MSTATRGEAPLHGAQRRSPPARGRRHGGVAGQARGAARRGSARPPAPARAHRRRLDEAGARRRRGERAEEDDLDGERRERDRGARRARRPRRGRRPRVELRHGHAARETIAHGFALPAAPRPWRGCRAPRGRASIPSAKAAAFEPGFGERCAAGTGARLPRRPRVASQSMPGSQPASSSSQRHDRR